MAFRPVIIDIGVFKQLPSGEALDAGGWNLPMAGGTEDYALIADASGHAVWAQPDHGDLAGLSDDDHPQYVRNNGETSNVDLGSQTITTTGTVIGSNIPAPTASNQILQAVAANVAAWSTDVVSLTSLTVDNIAIDGATILSTTGDINFGDEDLTTTGHISANHLHIDGAIDTVDYIQFDMTYADGAAEGRLQWNIEDGTLEVGLPGGNVNLQIGEEQIIKVRNVSGSTISNGSAVYVTGAQANRPTIGLADASGSPPGAVGAMGLATETINNNSNGYVTVTGMVRGVDTSAYTEGDRIWLSDTTPGGWTGTMPDAPSFRLLLGYVIRQHATEGIVVSNPLPFTSYMFASGVKQDTPSDGEWLRYQTSTSQWILAGDSSIDHGVLTGLTDDDHPQYVTYTGASGTVDLGAQIFTTTGTVVGSNVPAPTVTAKVLTSTGANTATWQDPTGVTDHGALTGLTDDDHPQYPTKTGWDIDYSSNVTLAFNEGTRTFSITPTGADFSYWVEGVEYTKTTQDSVVVTDTEGMWFITYDGATLTASQTVWNLQANDKALVAFLYWDASGNKLVGLGYELHSWTMDVGTHSTLHNTRGSVYATGLALGNMDVDGSGSNASAARLSVGNGVIYDEDIKISITDDSPQDLSTVAEIPILWRTGASGLWRKIVATTYPCHLHASANRLAYNEWTGSTWQQTEIASNNDFVLMHLFTTNDVNEPIIAIMGQDEYTTTKLARKGAETEMQNLALGVLAGVFTEFVPIATVIFQTNSSWTNAVHAIVVSTDDGDDYIDWRESTGARSTIAGVTSHANLSGLATGDDHPQYVLNTGETSPVDLGSQVLTTTGTVVGSNIPSPTVSDQVLISSAADITAWLTAGTNQLLASSGGVVAWTNKSFGYLIPANSAQYQVYVGTGAGTAAWTTDLAGITSLTVDNITINGAVISSDTGAISFSDENLTTTGSMTANTITDGTASLTGGSLTSVKLGSLTTNGFVKTSGSDGTLSIDTSTYLTTEADTLDTVADRGATTDQTLIVGGLTTIGTVSAGLLTVDDITINGAIITSDTGVVNIDDPVSINSAGSSALWDLQVGDENSLFRLGNGSYSSHTVFGNKAKDEVDANEYESYFTENAYWDATALEWKPVRAALGRRAKFSMGYHQNGFTWSYHAGADATITWVELMNLDYNGALTGITSLTVDNITINGATISSDTGAISFSDENLTTTGTVVGSNIPSPTADDQALSSTASGIASWNVTCLADVLAQEVPSASGAERKFVLTANSASKFVIESAPWTIMLTANETIYVRTTGNDTTGDGSSGSPFLTLERTIEFLGGLYIGDFTITVDIGEGIFTETGTLSFQHPFGGQVTWQGVSEQITSQDTNSISASGTTLGFSNLYRYDVTFILPVGKSVSVGDYIAVREVSGGTLPQALYGCHYVSGWDGGTRTATVQVVYRNGAPKASGTVTCTIELIKTVIAFSDKNGLKVNGPYHAGLWEGLVIQGNYNTSNTNAKYGVWLLNTSVISLSGSSATGKAVGIVGFQTGLYAQNNAMVFSDDAFVSKCGLRCANAQNGGILNLRYARLSGANNNGIFAFNGSTVAAQEVAVVGVGDDSVLSYQGAFIDCTSSYVDQNNATNAFSSDRWAGCDATGATYSDAINPATGGNNDGSYVIT